jgi:hypothetical protein
MKISVVEPHHFKRLVHRAKQIIHNFFITISLFVTCKHILLNDDKLKLRLKKFFFLPCKT